MFLTALLGAAALGLPSLLGTTITVTEVGDGLGVHTNLRQALADANDGDTIEFDPLLGGRNLPVAPSLGQLVVNKRVTIRWVATAGYLPYLGVDAQQANRVFYISRGKTVTISGLAIINGSAPADYDLGGGIYNDEATLTLNNCTISGNAAVPGFGGGIYNSEGTVTLKNTTLSGNSAWPGAGIFNELGTVTITNSTVSNNSTQGLNTGGGIYNVGALTITSSTISGNTATDSGAGIYNGGGSVTIANCTFSGNSAPNYGGAIYSQGGSVSIGATILNAGSSGVNIYNLDQFGQVTSLGYNLSSDNAGGYLTATGDLINTDPRLGPLQDNGGPTFTHLPASDSPAIDAGDPDLITDQRGSGFSRVVNNRVDIGAVEVQAAPSPTPTPTPTPRPHGRR